MDPASPIDRRCFIKWSLLVGSSVASLPAFGLEEIEAAQPTAGAVQAGTRILRAGCPSHNCGGRCLLALHVENGVIVRIETDDRPTDTLTRRNCAPASAAAPTAAASTTPTACSSR